MEVNKWKVECSDCTVAHCKHYNCKVDEQWVSTWQCENTQFKKRFCTGCRLDMVHELRKKEVEKIVKMQESSEEFDMAKQVFKTGLQPLTGTCHYWQNGKTGEEFMSCKDDPVEAWEDHLREKKKYPELY